MGELERLCWTNGHGPGSGTVFIGAWNVGGRLRTRAAAVADTGPGYMRGPARLQAVHRHTRTLTLPHSLALTHALTHSLPVARGTRRPVCPVCSPRPQRPHLLWGVLKETTWAQGRRSWKQQVFAVWEKGTQKDERRWPETSEGSPTGPGPGRCRTGRRREGREKRLPPLPHSAQPHRAGSPGSIQCPRKALKWGADPREPGVSPKYPNRGERG